VEIAHAPSVGTVVPGVLGLQWYKFGRTTTIPFPRPNFRPESPYGVIRDNLREGLHTLVLLDIDPPRLMTAREGLEYLMEIESTRHEDVISEDRLVCAVARAGSESQFAAADTVSRLMNADLGPPPHALVFPGSLHYMEERALSKLRLDAR
jgi:diphthine synthase